MPNGIGRAVSAGAVHRTWAVAEKNDWQFSNPRIDTVMGSTLTLFGVVSSDVSRSSRTTSFPPCCSIFSQSHVFFQGCPCPLLDVIYVLHPGTPPSPFPRHHSENASLYKITQGIVSACISKESHFFLLIIWAPKVLKNI